MTALAGLVIAALLWWGLKTFAKADPPRVAQLLKVAGGLAALAAAGLLMLRGRLDMAALAGGAAAWLLGWSAARPGWLPSKWALPGRRKVGSSAIVRSPFVEMALDPETGALSGTVLAGELAGRSLASLDPAEFEGLRRSCLARDLEGLRLLEAYLDRCFPGRRENAERDADGRGRPDLQRGAMTEQEAHQILGLQPGASAEEIRAAHRGLMMRLHPDQGGSTYLASRVNQAKDLLLDRHR